MTSTPLEREEVWRESKGVARTAFAAHRYTKPFVASAGIRG